MKSSRLGVCVAPIIALALSACATTDTTELTAEQQAEADRIAALIAEDPNAVVETEVAEERIVCRRVRTLGSNIPERVCRNVTQDEETMRNIRDSHRAISRSTTGPRDPMAGQREGG